MPKVGARGSERRARYDQKPTPDLRGNRAGAIPGRKWIQAVAGIRTNDGSKVEENNRGRRPFDLLAVTNTAWQNEKTAGANSSGLRPIWLPAVDTLRNMFYAPTVEMKITFELLRRDRYALY